MKYQKDLRTLAKEWAYKRTQITGNNDTFESIAREAWLAGNAVANQELFSIKDFLPNPNVQVLVYGKTKSNYKSKVQPAKLKKNWTGGSNPFEPEFVWESYDIIDYDGEVDEIEYVTHWMPMPPEPTK